MSSRKKSRRTASGTMDGSRCSRASSPVATPICLERGPWTSRNAESSVFTTPAGGAGVTAGELFGGHPDEVPRITTDALNELLNSADPPLVLDVRTRSAYEHDGARIAGSRRVVPDAINDWAPSLPLDRRVIAYCT